MLDNIREIFLMFLVFGHAVVGPLPFVRGQRLLCLPLLVLQPAEVYNVCVEFNLLVEEITFHLTFDNADN